MNISSKLIETILIDLDIEGLIELGAPNDEYGSEAQIISRALSTLLEKEVTQENISEVIAQVWRESFNLSSADLELRNSAIRIAAQTLLEMNKEKTKGL